MRLPPLWFASALATLGCNPDSGLTLHDNNRPPEVSFVAPGAGERFIAGEAVTFEARVEDDATALEDLELSWRTTNGGALVGDGTSTDGTVTLVALDLAAGEHTVSLTALDAQAASGEAEVAFVVEDNGAPTVAFEAPTPDGRYALGASVPVVVAVDDDWDTPDGLGLSWGDAAAGVTGVPNAPDDAGEARFTLSGLALGSYRVSVTAADRFGSTRTLSVDFDVVNPDGDDDGHVALDLGGDDCDDAIGSTHPGADEVCDGDDNDCDGLDDNDATDASTWFFDDDLDGYGDPGVATVACAAPGAKWKAQAGDCDDDDNARFPGNPELCDGRDNDCATGIDDGLTFASYYTDGDGDTWGLVGSGVSACAQPSDTATRGGDCNDGNDLVHPGQTEVCNGLDDNCAAGPDDGLAFATYWYDDDLDGFGDTAVAQSACADPGGKWKTVGGDCADHDNARFPGHVEVCNGLDDNCATGVDEGLTFATYYTDSDHDTWGLVGSGASACAQPVDTATRGGDCNDGSDLVNPGKTEVCNGVDDDCTGGTDNGLTFVTYYTDSDHDTWGLIGSGASACAQPADTATRGGDCNDLSDQVNPGKTEVCNGVDDDCTSGADNGLTFTTYFTDSDHDTWGLIGSGASACAQPANTATRGGDCNDNSGQVNPGKLETCNGVDDDCAGGADNGLAFATWYYDSDLDGFGDPAVSQSRCDTPSSPWINAAGDCDDDDDDVNPLETEVCGNGVDDDCANGIDDECDIDYSGTWKLYTPAGVPTTVSYGCDNWTFSFDTVTIVDTSPTIVVTPAGAAAMRVNGCEPALQAFCSDHDGMTGEFDSSTEWTAWDSIDPFFGIGYYEIYEWLDSSGTEGTDAEFTDATTFVGSFAWHFLPSPPYTVPALCTTGHIAVEGRKQ